MKNIKYFYDTLKKNPVNLELECRLVKKGKKDSIETRLKKRDNNLFKPLNCFVPFLSSELFEPINSYDWKNVQILLNLKKNIIFL